VESLSDAILSIVRADLVYVRLKLSDEGEAHEVARTSGPRDKTPPAGAIGAALAPWLVSSPASPITIADPLGAGSLRIFILPLDDGNARGEVCIGSRRAEFPTEMDQLICRVVCNEAAVAIRAARLVEELRRLRDDLEIQVQERTAKLIQVNHTLRAEVEERKRAERELKDSLDQVRVLSSHLQSAREEERARIAREIHDELGQSLTALKMDLAWLRRGVKRGSAAVSSDRLLEKIDSMNEIVDTTIGTVQRIATELRPAVLDTLGLVSALEWHARDFQKRTGIRCEFISNVDSVDLDQGRMMAVFRIFQESLTNVWRHAKATRVRARLNRRGRILTLTIQDDGVGIGEADITGTESLGLMGMRERALLLGGDVRIVGAPKRGTKVTLRLPIPP